MFGRALSLLLFAAFPLSLLAQTADLVSTVHAPAVVKPDEKFIVQGSVVNKGPNAATDVRVALGDFRVYCPDTIPLLASGESRTFTCETSVDISLGVYLIEESMNASSEVPDPNPTDNWAASMVTVDAPPDLFVFMNGPGIPVPELPAPLTVHYGNRAASDATNTTITITSPAGFSKLPDFCKADGARAVCSTGTLPGYQLGRDFPRYPKSFPVEILAPPGSATPFTLTVTIDAAEEESRPIDNHFDQQTRNARTFFVENTADRGSGSLRAAFEGVNAECVDTVPCLVAFRLPPSAAAWHTIELESPLPILRHPVTIDGTTQSRYFADTNPAGPEIEIRGSALREGSGIVTTCQTAIRALTINGFPESGILMTTGREPDCTAGYAARLIADNYIGTDPTGLHAIPNTVGIGVNERGFSITGNIISGNRRSGIFAGSGMVSVSGNRIGLDAALQPLGNGASGVFISTQSSGSDVSNNYIGFNRHFGVAIARDASYVSAASNSIQANGQGGIDWGLDGAVTPNPVPIPEITSVRVEDGQTIIEGTTTAAGTFEPAITLYANDEADPSGYGEGQYVLGEVRAGHQFRFVSPTDLRGKWITATATRQQYFGWLRNPGVRSNGDTGWYYYTTTSEFSRAVKVE